jgi:hypothetical protein
MRHGHLYGNGAGQGPHAPPVRNSSSATAIPFAQRLTCTIAEACEATGLGRTKLYELIGEGCLDTTTIVRRLEIIGEAADRIIKAEPMDRDINEIDGS